MSGRVDAERRRARRAVLAALLALAVLLVPACATRAALPDGPTADCPVCRHEGDLACVSVRIEPATPRLERGGEVHYFCSEECRADFRANPERYAGR